MTFFFVKFLGNKLSLKTKLADKKELVCNYSREILEKGEPDVFIFTL
jgi:hypothetical protein